MALLDEQMLRYFSKEILSNMVYIRANKDEVTKWSAKRNIDAVYIGTFYDEDVWYVEDKKNLLIFKLRWSK